MKTIMIWDTCGAEPIKFAVLDGDYSYLNETYIGEAANTEESEAKIAGLEALTLDDDNGRFKITFLDSFPVHLVEPDTKVIVAGFFP